MEPSNFPLLRPSLLSLLFLACLVSAPWEIQLSLQFIALKCSTRLKNYVPSIRVHPFEAPMHHSPHVMSRGLSITGSSVTYDAF